MTTSQSDDITGIESTSDVVGAVGCQSDFIQFGMLDREQAGTLIRMICTLITLTIVSSWCGGNKIRRLLVFFVHWLSGLVNQLSQLAMLIMIHLCYSKTDATGWIKFFKFTQQTGTNMLAFTNLAICINLALVVSSQRSITRNVKNVSSPWIMLGLLAVSLLETLLSAVYWDIVFQSNSQYWMGHADLTKTDWIYASGFVLELFVGIIMLAIMAVLLTFRRPELRQCWKVHRRVKYYFALTVIATGSDLAIGITNMFPLFGKKEPHFLQITWAVRQVHIALDTLVLYGTLNVYSDRVQVVSVSPPGDTATPHRNHSSDISRQGTRRSDKASSLQSQSRSNGSYSEAALPADPIHAA